MSRVQRRMRLARIFRKRFLPGSVESPGPSRAERVLTARLAATTRRSRALHHRLLRLEAAAMQRARCGPATEPSRAPPEDESHVDSGTCLDVEDAILSALERGASIEPPWRGGCRGVRTVMPPPQRHGAVRAEGFAWDECSHRTALARPAQWGSNGYAAIAPPWRSERRGVRT